MYKPFNFYYKQNEIILKWVLCPFWLPFWTIKTLKKIKKAQRYFNKHKTTK